MNATVRKEQKKQASNNENGQARLPALELAHKQCKDSEWSACADEYDEVTARQQEMLRSLPVLKEEVKEEEEVEAKKQSHSAPVVHKNPLQR